jgi:hypothetical protein
MEFVLFVLLSMSICNNTRILTLIPPGPVAFPVEEK